MNRTRTPMVKFISVVYIKMGTARWLCVAAIVVLLALSVMAYQKLIDRTVYVVIDGEDYLVRKTTPEHQYETAKLLHELIRRGDLVVAHMKLHNYPSAEVANRLASRWESLRSKRWGIRETSVTEGPAAYLVFKTLQMRMCLRRPDGHLEDLNTAMYVFLHELAHVMSVSYDHEHDFPDNFAAITQAAVNLGVYHYVNYANAPTSYCNVEIKHASYY